MANKKNNRPRQGSAYLGIRALVLIYVLYLAFGIAASYLRGDPDALSLPLTVLTVAVLVIVTLVMLVLTYRQWRRDQTAAREADEQEGRAGGVNQDQAP